MSDAAALKLDPAATALVLVDLQKGIVARQTHPHGGEAVVKQAAKLTSHFRKKGATIVLVHVVYSPDGKDRLKAPIDAPPVAVPATPDFGEIVPELGRADTDLIITKRQWGAFYGTELDLQLRRRGVSTIVLGGISTNMGVESTARAASELGYAIVFAEDAMSGLSPDAHQFAVTTIFPRLGRIRSTDQILSAL